ncbi:unnamed protein product [Acanthoscelides obtectus]|uniref:Secreted protein n=1 Tax=Acanthoscelides obtectus TaxID=200917 RepID=A0A9P0MHZ5_ACAOB|nr:unnamed protein product [Acanthoscelides obtectus]CAK1676667.1 hypothetical protein AOBTE_LOCUS30894 [Acanthoscelides obtectus]
MTRGVFYTLLLVVLKQVICQSETSADQYEERVQSLANEIQRVVVSESTRIALAKDAMGETVNEAVESIEKELVELHEIADAIKRRSRNEFCSRTITLINNISVDSLRACDYSSKFDDPNRMVEKVAKLYSVLNSVTQACELVENEEADCINQLLVGIEHATLGLTEQIKNAIAGISKLYLDCIQANLAAIDEVLENLGHRVQQCV